MKEKQKRTDRPGSDGEKTLLPKIKKNISNFLTREEARISEKRMLSGAVVLLGLGIAATEAFSAHTSQHNSGVRHSNITPHISVAPHHNYAIGHDSWAPHANLSPHHSDTTLGLAHVSGHTNNVLSEAVTKGTLHNDAAAGYGKHSAGTAHNNVVIVNSGINNVRGGHASVAPHNSTAPHTSLGAGTFNVVPHQSSGLHVNQTLTPIGHYNGPWHTSAPTGFHVSHGSHGSHGQW